MSVDLLHLWAQMGAFAKGIVVIMAIMSIYSLTIVITKLVQLKKSEREGTAYPGYRQRLIEEFGDVLWYFVRLTSELDAALLDELPRGGGPAERQKPARSLLFLLEPRVAGGP